MSTPLTLSLSDHDETRGRLWTWLVRLGIGRPQRMAYPGWIPEQQRQCVLAEAFLASKLCGKGLRIINADTALLRRRGDSIEFQRKLSARWEPLCTVAELLAATDRTLPAARPFSSP